MTQEEKILKLARIIDRGAFHREPLKKEGYPHILWEQRQSKALGRAKKCLEEAYRMIKKE